MEKLLYAQVATIIRNDLKFVAENKNKNVAKFKFQGQYVRSQRWFDLEFDRIVLNFSPHEPDFYKKLFLIHDNAQDTNAFKLFQVPI